ncbi:MAG: sensor domain-containing diguanylate cyclase [Oscillospiraceae bacterium]|nr:sensor domain-containing diguanylate cyclase [Oscillospiraceae bacterium]
MIDQRVLYCAILSLVAVFNLITAVCTLLLKNTDAIKRRWMFWMQIFAATMLVGDAAAWYFHGRSGELAYWAIRLANYTVFTSVDVILILFNGYVCSCIFEKGQEHALLRSKLVTLLGLVGVVLVAVSQRVHLYYNFDSSNYYYRCSGYLISVLIPVSGLLLDLSMLIQRRNSITRGLYLSILGYIALPLAATMVQTVDYGYPLISCAVGISMILLVLGMTLEQNRELGALARTNAETQARLEIATTLNQCVAELSSGKEISDAIQKLLEVICRYFSADRTYIFQIDEQGDTLSNTFEFTEENVSIQKDNLQAVPLELISAWMAKFRQEQVYYIPTLEQERGSDTYEMLAAQGVERLLAVPLMKERAVVGFLGVDNPTAHYDDPTLLSSIQFFISNSLDMQKQQQWLRYLSSRDMLTKLYNRNEYIMLLESIGRKPMENIGAAYMDLNGLKEINDRYGHEAGDRMISRAAAVLLKYFSDHAFRVGGDEFIIVYPNIGEETFLKKIEDARNSMRERHVSISVGAVWRKSSDDLEEMLKAADQLMYVEKEQYHQRIADQQEGNVI